MRLVRSPAASLGIAAIFFGILSVGYGFANLGIVGDVEPPLPGESEVPLAYIYTMSILLGSAAAGSIAILLGIPLLRIRLIVQLVLVALLTLTVLVAIVIPTLFFGIGVRDEPLEIVSAVGPTFGVVAAVMLLGLRTRPAGVLVVAFALVVAFMVILLLLPLCPPEALSLRPPVLRSPLEGFCLYWPFFVLPAFGFFALEFLYPIPRLPRTHAAY